MTLTISGFSPADYKDNIFKLQKDDKIADEEIEQEDEVP